MAQTRNRESKGSIIKRGKKQFQAQITVKGKRYSATYTSKTAAEEGLRRLRNASRRPDRMAQALAKENQTLGELLAKREAKLEKSDSASHRETARNIRHFLRIAPGLAALRLTDVWREDIDEFVEQRLDGGRVEGTTVNKDLSLISKCFTDAGLENPVKQVGWFPRKKKSMLSGRLTPEQESAIVQAAAKVTNEGRTRIHFAELIVFALATGVRAGELVGMRWEHIRWHEGVLYLPQTKNGDERMVPLRPSTMGILYRLGPEDSGSVWGAKYRAMNRAWNLTRSAACEMLSNAGFTSLAEFLEGFKLHDLRFEATCRYVEEGVLSNRQVTQAVGHRTESMFIHYSQLLNIRVAVQRLAEYEGVDWKLRPARPEPPAPEEIARRAPEWRRLRSRREELEARVWSQPIWEIAEDLGVSDVAIHKACRRLKVQKPKRGYWLQRERRVPPESSDEVSD